MQFFKVSREQFEKDWEDCKKNFAGYMSYNSYNDNPYDEIKLPKRATKGSAGYDFYSPLDFTLDPGDIIKFPTGIRAKIDNGWALLMFPRSGLGFKYRLQLNNTVGIIDSDYFSANNEGHIFIKLTNDGDKRLYVEKGDAIVQGIFMPFGVTIDDDADGVRVGGFGSTSK